MNLTFLEEKIVRASSVIVPEYLKHRLSTGIQWLDEALGTKEKPGFIAGSIVLIAGDPGSGKSTILRQLCSMTDLECLYNTREEHFEQVKMALDEKVLNAEFDLANYSNVDALIENAEKRKYSILVVDSVQTLWTETDINGVELKNKKAGSTIQIVACAEKLTSYAKTTGTMVWLICHATKGGDFAGPQALEHIIDAACFIDVDKEDTRILSFTKNRFGATNKQYPLCMGAHGIALAEDPERYTEEQKHKAEEGKMPVKKIARKLFADNFGCTKDQFVQMVMDETHASLATATQYWHMLRRERQAA